jgi:hypothetical protein
VFWAAWLLTMAGLAEPPKLSTAFVQKRLTVGDQFTVTLKLSADNDARIVGPLADSLEPFMVVGQKDKTRAHRGRNEHFYDLKLAGFRPGSFTLPRFLFMVSQGDKIDTLRSDTLKVVVSSVLPEKMQDIHDLKAAEAFPNHWLWLIPAGLLLLAGLAWLGYRLWLKYRRYREQLLAPLPPWEEALKALEEVPAADWLDKGQIKRYYYTLSEITKRYLERRFSFNALEQTTTEISSNMKLMKLPLRENFVAFLSRADMVKYAKIVPPRQEMDAAVGIVRDLVERTRPAPEPAATGGRI